MYKVILEARYTNDQQDTILVLHQSEEDGIIEEVLNYLLQKRNSHD